MLSLLLTSVLAAAAVEAAPAHNFGGQTGSIKIDAPSQKLPAPDYYRHDLLKHGLEHPHESHADHAKRQATASGSAVTTYGSKAFFTGNVTIGGQSFGMVMDTGSSDLWAVSSTLASTSAAGHKTYNPASSTTWKNMTNYAFGGTYASGSKAVGYVGNDTVTVGGVTVPVQAFGVATTVNPSMMVGNRDGIMGFGFWYPGSSMTNNGSVSKQKNWIANALPTLKAPIFGANLKSTGGQIDFGFADTTAYKGALAYTATKSLQYGWIASTPTYGFSGGNYSAPSGYTASLDTGSTNVIVDNTTATNYYSKIAGAQYTSSGWFFNCTATVPDFQIQYGSIVLNIAAKDINTQQTLSAYPGKCYSGIQIYPGLPYWIIGQTFFKSNYVVFDFQGTALPYNPRVGVATKSS